MGVTWWLTTSPDRTAQSRSGILRCSRSLDRLEEFEQLGFWQQVEQDREVVGDAASEHEQVPDHVAVG